MSKPHLTSWGMFLLLCTAGIAFLDGAAKPAAGDDPHISYLPVIVQNRPPYPYYLPVVVQNRPRYPYVLQPGSPTYLSNFLNTAGCNWFGIVGRAFGLDGNPVINLTVHLEGGGINTDVLTGTGPSALGPGGYEITISDHPIDTTDTYRIQLRNNSGNLLSDIYSIRTYGDCPRNLVLVNFVATRSLPMDTPTPAPTLPTQASPTPTFALPNTPTPTHVP